MSRLGPPFAWWALAALLAAYAAMTLGAPGGDQPRVARAALYASLLTGAAVLSVSRARASRRERAAWCALGAALLLWLAGDAAWSLALAGDPARAFPSLADGLWLAGYPAAYAGLALLLRARLRGMPSPTTWLDGAIVGTAGTAIVAAAALERGAGEGGALAVLASLAYPVGDVLLLTLAAGTVALVGFRPGRAFAAIAVAVAAYAVADGVRLLGAEPGTALARAPIDALWPLGALLVLAAATCPAARVAPRRDDGRVRFAAPALFTLAALGVVVYDRHVTALSAVAVDLALCALALLLARLGLSLRENARLLQRSRHEAMTDALTGLGNRRALMAALDAAADREPQVLALFDLDGFKRYNDVFGHVAGDVLLEHLGHRLAAAVEGDGLAFRMGGDEFCVLAPADRADAVLERALAALREAGDGFSVDSSVGTVAVPGDADEPEAALRLADQRMYAQKERRPASAARQSLNVLLRAIGEREPELLAHTEAVADLARAVAANLGLDPEMRDIVARAAELHDVGKVAIPDAILGKPGPLDDEEFAFMRRHTIIGETIIEAAPALRPVAALVRASHERWDGGGYPDGLAGEQIPLGARVVAVCDAYSAMVQARPYGEVLGETAALEELQRCAGTQFDPDVVDAFCAARMVECMT